MFCNKCGSVVPNGMKFCHKCGAQLPVLDFQRTNETPRSAQQSGTAASFVAQASDKVPKRRRVPAAIYIVAVLLVLILSFVTVYYGTGAVVKNKANSVYYLEAYDEYGIFLGSGSGFLISRTDIATNYHVIEDAASVIAVAADNSEEVTISTVAACDKSTDLTVLRSPTPLKANPLKLANSDSVRQGDKIYAIGYPLGLSNTLSDGIVSARYTDLGVDYLQITAAISPGSSGGALLNTKGKVVGVVCAYYDGAQNLNVAITSNTLNRLYSGTLVAESLSTVS